MSHDKISKMGEEFLQNFISIQYSIWTKREEGRESGVGSLLFPALRSPSVAMDGTGLGDGDALTEWDN